MNHFDSVLGMIPAIDDIAGLVVPMLVMLIPIIAILTKHQRSMAALYMGQQPQLPSAEIEDMRRQLNELRQLVVQQNYVIDEMKRAQALPASSVELQQPQI